MVDSAKPGMTRSINPWVLHLQKLGLELKCPLCLSFFNRPFLLPCDHIFCSSCLPETAQFGAECPICNARYGDKDGRYVPFIENMVGIYKSVDAGVSVNKLQPASLDTGRSLQQCGLLSIACCKNKSSKESVEDAYGHINSGESGSLRSSHNLKLTMDSSMEDVAWNMTNDSGSGAHHDNSLPVRGNKKGFGGCGEMHTETNQVDQLPPCSPPSFKDSENDSNDQGGDNSSQNSQALKCKVSTNGKKRYERSGGCAPVTAEGDLAGSKKNKKLKCGHAKQITPKAENIGASFSQSEKAVEPPLDLQSLPVEKSSVVKTICGFCQSSKISEYTGPMLHFVNEKMIDGNNPIPSNAMHVHSECIEWAPRVYYEGEATKNLKSELARGEKIKCSKCGQKGAPLGCYQKSCKRSYHAPCAKKISNCRWDYDNFLMFCPSHSSLKFPNEKSQPEKHNLQDGPAPMPIEPRQSNFWAGSSNIAKEWVFCGSALSSEDRLLLVKFGSMIGVPVTKFWLPTVTHVIAATDAKGACTRTLKVLMATLNGKWVLTVDWIKACMESKHPVDEERYEISLDSHGCLNGPKRGRLSALNNAPKLFRNLNFYFSGEFLRGYKEDLQNLVIAAGGTIVLSEEELVEQSYDHADPSRTLIVYNLDPPHGCELGEEVSIIWQRANEAGDLAAKIRSQVIIGHTWLLESISAYQLQPLVN